MEDRALILAVESLRELVESQWKEVDTKVGAVDRRVDAVDQKVDLRCTSIDNLIQTSQADVRADIRQMRDHIAQFHMVPKTEINNMSPDYRQYADNGGSNQHNSTAMVKWGAASLVIVTVAALAFAVGGRVEAEHDTTRIKIESQDAG